MRRCKVFSPSLGDMRNLLTMMEQTRKFGHQWFGDIQVSQRFHGNPNWNSRHRSLGSTFSFWKKSDDLRHRFQEIIAVLEAFQ